MFLILFTLKLLGVITVSWWIVCAPLFVVPAVFVVTFVLVAIVKIAEALAS